MFELNEKVKNLTNGDIIFERIVIIEIENFENFSAFSIAILLGTNSPKTKVK